MWRPFAGFWVEGLSPGSSRTRERRARFLSGNSEPRIESVFMHIGILVVALTAAQVTPVHCARNWAVLDSQLIQQLSVVGAHNFQAAMQDGFAGVEL